MTLEARSLTAKELHATLNDDEKVRAVLFDYNGGDAVVCMSLLRRGHDDFSLKKLPSPRWLKWLTSFFWTPWRYQARYGGKCVASSCATRRGAVREAKRIIDAMKRGDDV